jgi:HEPN domain-containing protein
MTSRSPARLWQQRSSTGPASPPELARYLESAKILDKHYIPTRYPNGLDAGAPADAYTRTEAEGAIGYAKEIFRFCQTRCSAQG